MTTRSLSTASARPLPGLAIAVGVGLAVGAFTAYGQGWLGDSVASLANSAGPWSVAAFLVARLQRRRVAWAVVAAVVTLAACEVGYVLATEIRGGDNARSTVIFWLTAAVLAGPPLGVAASWSTRRGLLGSLGWAVLGGVLVGEAVYGWTEVGDTTNQAYWAVEAVVGAVIVTFAATRSRRRWLVPATVAVAALTAFVVYAAARFA